LGEELSTEGAVDNVGAVINDIGADGTVAVVVVVIVAVEVEEEPKRLGPLTVPNGEVTEAYARKPPPPCRIY